MKHSENDDSVFFGHEVDQVRKPSDRRAADVAMLDGKPQWVFRRNRQAPIDFLQEPLRQSGLPFLIPIHGRINICTRGGPKGNRQRHDLMRALIEVLTSCQGVTSSGCCR